MVNFVEIYLKLCASLSQSMSRGAMNFMKTTLIFSFTTAFLVLSGIAAQPLCGQAPDASTKRISSAVSTPTPEQRIEQKSEMDHQRMMKLLGISSLRHGAENDPASPFYANYDEKKADPYPVLPDPLLLKDGSRVTSPTLWQSQRRAEIFELYDREILGRVPPNLPPVSWQLLSSTQEKVGDVAVVSRHLSGRIDNSEWSQVSVTIDLVVTTPSSATGPVPVIMELGFSREFLQAMQKRFPQLAPPAEPSWQQMVLARGWGYAEYVPTSVQADNGAGLSEGIIGLASHGQPRKPDDWGVLRAWAWGASQCLNYLETDKRVNATQVGLEGHSRYGKAALVAMAYDPRFAIGFISSSGEAGAKLYRRNFGEQVGNIAGTGEYHWMAGNFLKYDGPLTVADLPVDNHELIALVAPRPLFISAGAIEGDGWVDAKGEFMAAVAAGPVYRLLGKKDLGTATFPPIGTGLMDGDLAFRQHTGGHTPTPNWPTFLDFAARWLHLSAVNQ